jgi:hypothetical protein
MAEALGSLSEDPRQADQGQGSGGEDQERRGVQKLRHYYGHRERCRCAVGYLAEHRGSFQGLLQMNMTTIL